MSEDRAKKFIEETTRLQQLRKERKLCEFQQGGSFPCLAEVFVYRPFGKGYDALCEAHAQSMRARDLDIEFVATKDEAEQRCREVRNKYE